MVEGYIKLDDKSLAREEMLTPTPHSPPDPAYAFAFVIQESFALRGRLMIGSEPHCKWHIPSGKMKTILRTPEGKLIESVATWVHTSPWTESSL
jgi:hypothetical protein